MAKAKVPVSNPYRSRAYYCPLERPHILYAYLFPTGRPGISCSNKVWFEEMYAIWLCPLLVTDVVKISRFKKNVSPQKSELAF